MRLPCASINRHLIFIPIDALPCAYDEPRIWKMPEIVGIHFFPIDEGWGGGQTNFGVIIIINWSWGALYDP